ncbi:MAG: hypothetical protein RLZZ127_2285 [Planctomycetota bacterium]|jgi:hypothetical protein
MRWWILIPAALFLLAVSGVVAIRIGGEQRLAQVQADLRATGRPDSYEAWRARLPSADPAAADALHAAVMAMPVRQVGTIAQKVLDGPAGMAPAKVRLAGGSATATRTATAAWQAEQRRLSEVLADQATAAAAVRAALAAPGATLGRRHRWPAAATEAATLLTGSGSDLITDLSATRETADHLRAHALVGPDPVSALADLRRLARAAADGEVLIEAMTGMAVQAICDEAHIDALLAGRVDRHAVAEWLAERPDPVAWLRRAYVGERCGFGALVEAMGSMNDLYPGSQGAIAGATTRLWWWTVRGHDLSFRQQAIAEMEDATRTATATTIDLTDPTWTDRWMRPISLESITNHAESMITALECDARFRTARATAHLMLAARGGPVPAAAPAALAPLLDAGPTRFRLGWESLGGRRIRVALDLAAPQPPVFDRPRYRRDRCLVAPPGTLRRPGRSEREGIEIELPP